MTGEEKRDSVYLERDGGRKAHLGPSKAKGEEQLVMTHETVREMTDSQRGDIVATMAGAIPSDLTFEEAQVIIGNKEGSFVAEIRKAFAKRRLNAIPADEEWFSLEVDDDVDPMDVVTSAGYNPSGWKYLGPRLSGKRTLQVKLVRLGYIRNLEEARKKVDELGYRLLEGQARESFKASFPRPDNDKGPVVFAGSVWRGPDGSASVAFLYGSRGAWGSYFFCSDDDFRDRWRWLVVGK